MVAADGTALLAVAGALLGFAPIWGPALMPWELLLPW